MECTVVLRGVVATLTDTHCTELGGFIEPDEDSPPWKSITIEVRITYHTHTHAHALLDVRY